MFRQSVLNRQKRVRSPWLSLRRRLAPRPGVHHRMSSTLDTFNGDVDNTAPVVRISLTSLFGRPFGLALT